MFHNDNNILSKRRNSSLSFTDIARAYFQRSDNIKDKNNLALLFSVFLSNRDAKKQNDAINVVKELERSRLLEREKRSSQIQNREKLLAVDNDFKNDPNYFVKKAAEDFDLLYKNVDMKNPLNIKERLNFINKDAKNKEAQHNARLETLERDEEGRIISNAEILDNIDKFYQNKADIALSPENLSTVHEGINKIKNLFGIDKDSIYESREKQYETDYQNTIKSLTEGYQASKKQTSGSLSPLFSRGERIFSETEVRKRKEQLKTYISKDDKNEFFEVLTKNNFSLPIRDLENNQVTVNPFSNNFDNIKILLSNGKEDPASKTKFVDGLTITSLMLDAAIEQDPTRSGMSFEENIINSVRVMIDQGHLKLVKPSSLIGSGLIQYIPLGVKLAENDNRQPTIIDEVYDNNMSIQDSQKTLEEIFLDYNKSRIAAVTRSLNSKRKRKGLSKENELNLLNKLNLLVSEDRPEELYAKELLKFTINPPTGLGNLRKSYDVVDEAYQAYIESFDRDPTIESLLFNRYTRFELSRLGRQKLKRKNITSYAQLNNLEPLN